MLESGFDGEIFPKCIHRNSKINPIRSTLLHLVNLTLRALILNELVCYWFCRLWMRVCVRNDEICGLVIGGRNVNKLQIYQQTYCFDQYHFRFLCIYCFFFLFSTPRLFRPASIHSHTVHHVMLHNAGNLFHFVLPLHEHQTQTNKLTHEHATHLFANQLNGPRLIEYLCSIWIYFWIKILVEATITVQ